MKVFLDRSCGESADGRGTRGYCLSIELWRFVFLFVVERIK